VLRKTRTPLGLSVKGPNVHWQPHTRPDHLLYLYASNLGILCILEVGACYGHSHPDVPPLNSMQTYKRKFVAGWKPAMHVLSRTWSCISL
jgi:hypothetical protein